MASVVIFGLAPAIALAVVPDLYALAYTTSLAASRGLKMYPKGLLAPLLIKMINIEPISELLSPLAFFHRKYHP
jgi:hypothetical protein